MYENEGISTPNADLLLFILVIFRFLVELVVQLLW